MASPDDLDWLAHRFLLDELSADEAVASFYHSLGIDPKKEYHTNTGRPVMIVRDGSVIRELFG